MSELGKLRVKIVGVLILGSLITALIILGVENYFGKPMDYMSLVIPFLVCMLPVMLRRYWIDASKIKTTERNAEETPAKVARLVQQNKLRVETYCGLAAVCFCALLSVCSIYLLATGEFVGNKFMWVMTFFICGFTFQRYLRYRERSRMLKQMKADSAN